ncbi:hypothetical protein [Psychrobacillus lasiicapitis]|uniref:Uncharacterized protein n=1 Tax=Psychrobacillus lasiicapitis TaxID=1636719 RepID=A0A544TI20_9BACI|nr:hypothetical protein [Psychrobacillus lasiicapitis]TQR17104.1 hypothetical protein FG382_02870 [Psychrobacillus lasiicapitis]
MDFFLWLVLSFIIIGFVVLVSMKKNMEIKLAFIKTNIETTKGSTQSIIWWIVGTTVWGIVSMILIVWCFHEYLG